MTICIMPNVKDTPSNTFKCLIVCIALDLLYIIPLLN